MTLEVSGLRTWLEGTGGTVRAIDGIDFAIGHGETFAIVGESGCGKSMTALSIMRLLPPNGDIVAGRIALDGEDLLALPEAAMRNVRGRRISMIFQEPATSLNPVMTVGAQIGEVLRRHAGVSGAAARTRTIELLDSVGIPDPAVRIDEFSFQLSGGMKQRVMIALALAAEPELLIADEPTTALDVTIQAQVLDLLKDLQRRKGTAILLITHDLGIVRKMADRVAVMYAGELVEIAPADRFFASPRHPYAQKLFAALPRKGSSELAVIPGQVPALSTAFTGCRFADRCEHAFDRCRTDLPALEAIDAAHAVRCFLAKAPVEAVAQPARAAEMSHAAGEAVLAVGDLKVHFARRAGILKRVVGHVRAVDGVSLEIARGRTTALVGESGCGKTTVGKAILRLIPATAGRIRFAGRDLTGLGGESLRAVRSDLQIIFQDPFASLNPRMRVADILEEGMVALGLALDAAARDRRISELLREVGLPEEAKRRYPHEFSGGQRQRIAIARALAVDPKLIICDEPTSALDVSVQAQILNLLRRLQRERGLAYLFITHNIAVVEYLAHEVAVMYLGRIVERGTTAEVLGAPRHPYTQALLASVPRLDGDDRRIKLEGEMPSPIAPPSGCHFHPRCPHAQAECRVDYPATRALSASHTMACILGS